VKALVIGGGIIGSSVAWRLTSEGVQVSVFERGRLGQEASWAAAGLIGPQAEAHEPGAFFDLALAGKRSFDAIVERLTAESGVDPEYDDHGVL
jgi:glycine oxidase